MPDSLVFRCLQYQGQELQYLDENGKVQTRILDNVFFKGRGSPASYESYVASFRYTGFTGACKRFLLDSKFKYVPLTDVLLPHKPINNVSCQPREELGHPQTRNTFHYNKELYHVTISNNFKVDDEVIWNTYSNRQEACIGKIVVIGARVDVLNTLKLVAIVNLEKIPQGGLFLPNHINFLDNLKNTFVVPENELLKLDEWISVMTKAEEEEWTVVNQKKRNKGKERPKSGDYGNTPHFSQSPSKKVSDSSSEDWHYENGQNGQRLPHSPNFNRRQKKQQQPQRPKTFHEEAHGGSSEKEENIPTSVNDWQFPLDKENFAKILKQRGGHRMGVQGNNNSCYMDASLFALFSFTQALDKFIVTEDDSSSNSSRLKDVLKNDIIFQMRQAPFLVRKLNIEKMRSIFGSVFNKEYLFRFMDVEDFLGDFFKLLDAPPFFHYDNGEGDHVHQIALPFTWDKSEYKPYIHLQTLLENSFKTFQVKLEKMPEDIFIVKLPVSDGVLIPCNGVIPDLNLDLANVMDSTKEGTSTKMTLCSVICLRNNHFVTWVRTGKVLNSTWVYMDSRPTIQMPYICHLPDVDQIIENALGELSSGQDVCNIGSYEPECENYSLFRHAYVCIYVKQ